MQDPQNTCSLWTGPSWHPHSTPQSAAHTHSLNTCLPQCLEKYHAIDFTGSSLSQRNWRIATSIMSLEWKMLLQIVYPRTWNVAWVLAEERNCGQPLLSSPLRGGEAAEKGVWAVQTMRTKQAPGVSPHFTIPPSKVFSNYPLLQDYSAYHLQTFHPFLKSHTWTGNKEQEFLITSAPCFPYM